MTMTHPPHRRLIGFLTISLILHAWWLTAPLRMRTEPPDAPRRFIARLVPRADRMIEPARIDPAQKPAVAAPLATQSKTPRNNPAPATATISPAPATPASPAIDLDAAIATARAYARETQPRTSLESPKPPLTVEAAIARATEPDVTIETRGPNGERVLKSKHSRCVIPLTVPLYMQGMEIPTQCEARKG